MVSPSTLLSSPRKTPTLILLILMVFSMGKAQAVTIDFDDLSPADVVESGSHIMLTKHYESLGVLFDGYINLVAESTKSAPNFLGGSIGFSIYFIDTPPTYVSMYVGSRLEHKVGIRATGVSGYFEDQITDGEVRGIQWEDSTPYRPNQFISFYIPEGISYIDLGGQADVYIDDLYFGLSVPEPGALILLWLGLLMIYLRRKCLP